jgi:tRNA/rRNA methyltransferase
MLKSYNMKLPADNPASRQKALPAPVIILVEPQLGENIGMVARAMANMGLSSLRLVAPRDGWPNDKAIAASSGASHILEAAQLFETLEEAIADCHFVIATSARKHSQAKEILGPQGAAQKTRARIHSGQRVAVLFGRERNGLEADEISSSHAILTFPVLEDFSSLNLAQAVLLFGHSWMLSGGEEGELLPRVTDLGSVPATSKETEGFFEKLVCTLQDKDYFKPNERKEVMKRNLRNIFYRLNLTAQDVQTLHGVLTSLKGDGNKPL